MSQQPLLSSPVRKVWREIKTGLDTQSKYLVCTEPGKAGVCSASAQALHRAVLNALKASLCHLNIIFSVQLIFFPFYHFCSLWWMRSGKEIPEFGGWQRGPALQLHWFISQKWTEKDLCCCREKLLNSYVLEQIRIKASYWFINGR